MRSVDTKKWTQKLICIRWTQCLNMQTSFLNVGEWRPQHERQNLDLDVEIIGIKVVYTDITILTTAAETAR